LQRLTLSALEQAVERIRDAPERWPIYFNEFQRYILRQFPFSLVYEDFSSEIAVFAVAHGRRQPGYWMDLVVTGL
jgi:toxin ParE1/3/4